MCCLFLQKSKETWWRSFSYLKFLRVMSHLKISELEQVNLRDEALCKIVATRFCPWVEGKLDRKSQWPLVEEIWLTTWDVWNPINNGINYQPQLVSRISAINSSTLIHPHTRSLQKSGYDLCESKSLTRQDLFFMVDICCCQMTGPKLDI